MFETIPVIAVICYGIKVLLDAAARSVVPNQYELLQVLSHYHGKGKTVPEIREEMRKITKSRLGGWYVNYYLQDLYFEELVYWEENTKKIMLTPLGIKKKIEYDLSKKDDGSDWPSGSV